MNSSKSLVRILIVIILLLVLCNAAVVTVLLLKKNGKRHFGKIKHKASREELFKSADFSEDQIAAFNSKSKSFRESMHDKHERLRELREALHGCEKESEIDSAAVDSIVNLLAVAESGMISGMLYHLRDLRSICDEDQLVAFEKWQSQRHRRGRPPGIKGKGPGKARK